MGGRYVVPGVCLLSIVSCVIVEMMGRLKVPKSENAAIVAGLVGLIVALVLTFLLFRRYFKRVDPFVYVFCLLCYDTLPSLILSLETDGYIPSLNSTTLVTGMEPFMKTSYGAVTTYWNGVVHLCLYLAVITLYVRRDSHRELTLYLAGSLLNLFVVMVPAVVTQKTDDQSMILFKAPFILLPILIIGYYMHRRPIQARMFSEAPKIWKRPVDLLFFLYFVGAATVVVFRGMIVLGGNASCMKDYAKSYEPYLKDASNYPKFQTLTYLYIYLAYYLSAMYGLLYPGQHWMADWSLVHAGGAAQAQFSYVAGSMNPRTPASLRPPTTGYPAVAFWSINVVMMVLPQLFALWCLRDPESHGRTYTVDLATPKYCVDDIVRKSARIHHKRKVKKAE